MGSLRRLFTGIDRLYESTISKWWTMLLCPTRDGGTGAIGAAPVPMGRVPLITILLGATLPVPRDAPAAPSEGGADGENVSVELVGCLWNSVWASFISKFATGPSTGGMQVAGTEGEVEGKVTSIVD